MLIKKNLVFFLPNFSKGGAANSIIKLCEKLDKKKYDIYTNKSCAILSAKNFPL